MTDARTAFPPVAHDSAAKHVAGEALYIDDMPEPPGTLHARIFGSFSRRRLSSISWMSASDDFFPMRSSSTS